VLFLLLAAAIEVYLHTRQYAVVPPEYDLDEPFYTSCQDPMANAERPRESAALVMLARNKELAKAIKTVQSIERHFNRWFRYPIVFLNDEPWSDDFIHAMNSTVSGEARFEVIPRGEWMFPEFVNEDAARASMAEQGKEGILYAGMETYHHMCRFYSGFVNFQSSALHPSPTKWTLCLAGGDRIALTKIRPCSASSIPSSLSSSINGIGGWSRMSTSTAPSPTTRSWRWLGTRRPTALRSRSGRNQRLARTSSAK
jgi:hypothetical protein